MLTNARNIFSLLPLICLFIIGCALTGTTTLTTRNGVMEASSSPLMWQQDRGPLFTSWEKANNYVNKLELGGYSDWRLPTKEEFLELYFAFDYGSANTRDLGIVIEGNFWSAEKGGMGFSGAWKDGDSCEISRDYKLARKGYVRAVRP
ncbi:MAG: DUF1566 domain-containing protein [Thermodesulfobacteriota bacterium]